MVSKIGRMPRMNVSNSRTCNTLTVDVESRLSEYRRMPAKRRTGVDSEWVLADLDSIVPRFLMSNMSNEVV